MNDPYLRDAPSVADPANNLVDLTQDDNNPIPVGVKALRIFNPATTVSDLAVKTVGGNTITLKIPAGALVVEPLRITHLLSGTTAGLIVQGYTDVEYVNEQLL